MRLDVSQQLRLDQQMKLAPRIIQAMEILQLPMMALQDRIDAEIQANPVLEVLDPGVDPEAPPARQEPDEERGDHDLVVDEGNGHSEDFERLADFSDEYSQDMFSGELSRRPATSPQERDRKLDAMANTPAPGETLNEHLLSQWAFVEAEEPVKAAGRLIINHIDDDGYLRVLIAELPGRTNEPISVEQLGEALPLVQTLEPTGVAARDLQECLLIQLSFEAKAGRDVSLETEIVRHFLRDVEANRLPQIARRLNRTVEDVKSALENLSHLNPRPGLLVGSRAAPVIRPDIMVSTDDDGLVQVQVNDGDLPQLHIAKAYRKLARDRGASREVRQFVQRNLRSAQWLIGAIQQRRQTVRRVAEEVFRAQRGFLDHGEEALKPLPMADVAARVGVHVATVSRAVAGKYVQTPRGIYPLRMFFSGGTKTAEGQDVAWDAVKVRLKEIVEGEDKSNPLNDDLLAEELKKHGIDIARRTVAKYRGLLDIPSARRRRQF